MPTSTTPTCGSFLTGSRMPEANFLGADLREAGLAEVDWPGADLRAPTCGRELPPRLDP